MDCRMASSRTICRRICSSELQGAAVAESDGRLYDRILDRVQVKKEDMTRLMKRVKEIDQSAERSDYEELLQKMKAKTAKDKKTAAKD